MIPRVSIVLLFSALGASPASADDYRLFDFLPQTESLCMRIDNVRDFQRKLGAMELWNHDDCQVLLDGLKSRSVSQLLDRSLRTKSRALATTIRDHPLTDCAYVLVSKSGNSSPDWTLAAPTTWSENQLENWLNQAGLQGLTPYWFLEQGYFVVASTADRRDQVRAMLTKKIEYPLSKSRRFQQAFLRQTPRKPSDIEIYFDPSRLQFLFPMVDQRLWKASGIENIVGSRIDIRIDKNTGDGSDQIVATAQLFQTFPPTPLLMAIESLVPVDRIPVIKDYPSEFYCLKVDPEKLYDVVNRISKPILGPGVLQNGVEEFLRSQGIEKPLDQLFAMFPGTFFAASLEGANGQPGVLFKGVECINAKLALAIAAGLTSSQSRYEFEEQDLTFGTGWFLSDKALSQYERRIRIANQNLDPPSTSSTRNSSFDKARNFGYAFSNGWLIQGEKQFLESNYPQGLIETALDESIWLKSILRKHLSLTESNEPVFVYVGTRSRWMTWAQSLIWKDEWRRRTLVEKSKYSMLDFDGRLPDLETVTTLESLGHQALIRLFRSLAQTTGLATFTVSRNGSQIEMGLSVAKDRN